MHLTNASINKSVPDAEDDAGVASTIAASDCKQLMSSVWSILKERGVNTTRLWERICRILTATIAILVTKVPNVREVASGFELFGFDVRQFFFGAFLAPSFPDKIFICDQVLLDSECRPWLMEVNCSPALSMDGPVDTQVKVPLLKDTFQMVTLHTRTFNAVAAKPPSCGRSPSATVAKVSSGSSAANPSSSARVIASDARKSSRSLSAPRFVS